MNPLTNQVISKQLIIRQSYKKMEKSFQVKVSVSPEELVTKIKLATEKQGLRFSGDIEKGFIKGFGIHILYLLNEDMLTIKFLRKPLLLSWGQVEQKVRNLISFNQNIS